MATVVTMPQLAAGEETATVQAWLVEAGDVVAKGQPIAEVETEKAVVDFESEEAGVLAGHLVEVGATVEVGTPIAVIAAEGEDLAAVLAEHSAAAPAAAAEPQRTEDAPGTDAGESPPAASAAPQASAEDHAVAETAPLDRIRRFASPLARKLARERSIALEQLDGSGPGGRIVRRDVESHRSAHAAPVVAVAPASAQPQSPSRGDAAYTDVPHTKMRQAIARRLTESKSSVPHFYLAADVQMDALLALRAQVNEVSPVRISVNDFVIKAVAAAMQDVPEANAIWTDDATRTFDGVDISVAVSIPGGLVTPVVRDVASQSVRAISVQMADYAQRAREGGLKQHDLVGGSFSVSNLGMFGTREFSAIINPPQSGILAVGAAAQRPVVDERGELAVATVMTVTLSADHRVLDGALAAQWLSAFVKRVEQPLGLLI